MPHCPRGPGSQQRLRQHRPEPLITRANVQAVDTHSAGNRLVPGRVFFCGSRPQTPRSSSLERTRDRPSWTTSARQRKRSTTQPKHTEECTTTTRRTTQDEYDKKARELKERQTEIASSSIRRELKERQTECEGSSIVIEYRWAEGRPERFAEIAAEFVRLKVDTSVLLPLIQSGSVSIYSIA